MLTWRDASFEVLKSGLPMTAAEIVEAIQQLDLRPVTGRTPDATVAALLFTAIADGDPRIKQVGPGVFQHTGSSEEQRTTTSLGRIEFLNIREVWADEARNFTPWLLENADYLSDVLGIEIELEQRELPVGSFSVDLFGRDLTNEAPLIVENQIEATDHRHLGQLLTYAAGTDATTVVWVASKFRDEHQQALEYLNHMTGDNARFFGIEIQAVVIGDSEPAPFFNLVVQPSDWRAQLTTQRSNSNRSEIEQRYLAFWTEFLSTLQSQHPGSAQNRRPRASKRIGLTTFRKRTLILVGFGKSGQVFVDLFIDQSDASLNRKIFDALELRKSEIESSIGTSLQWLALDQNRVCKVRKEGIGNINEDDQWPQIIDWLIKWFLEFKRVFSAEIAALDDSYWQSLTFDELDEDDFDE
jgi:hypothetical protein